MVYQITINGVLDDTWANWLGCVDMQTDPEGKDGGNTTLIVDLIDQAALFGLLDHIRDLNLRLVSVNEQL